MDKKFNHFRKVTKMNKYGNNKVVLDGMTFDSQKEARRWTQLKMFERIGEITGLRRQVAFDLIPSQRGAIRSERPVKYVADFVYFDKSGSMIVEDVKGLKTREYIIKRKLMKYINGIEIVEV